MSFFRNIRNTITRGKSSSRDTTPVRTVLPSTSSSTYSSFSNASQNRIGTGSGTGTGTGVGRTDARRDSVGSRTDSLLNRSDTFILDSSTEEQGEAEEQRSGSQSNTSTLEKKSKKSKVLSLSKFSTFTKRKKQPSTQAESGTYDHHPSDDATNTYYNWKMQSCGPSNLDYDSQTDPFNFLYEQHSSLRSMHSGGSESAPVAATLPVEATMPEDNAYNGSFDSSTYCKGKMPTQLKERLEQLKAKATPELYEEEAAVDPHSDKYKTVTLNTFRKSFRERFLQQQKDAPYNPAWFVEVEQPEDKAGGKENARQSRQEIRQDVLVFENDNYRPSARSPVRLEQSHAPRSPVRRKGTFKVARPTVESPDIGTPEVPPSIRIEIKNSIAPHMPTRVVPVGVAKPMPSTATYRTYDMYPQSQSHSHPQWSTKPAVEPPTRSTISPTKRSGRFQTLVQIRNEGTAMPKSTVPLSMCTNNRRSATCVQLGGNSPVMPKRQHYPTSRRPLAPQHATGLTSYELLRNSATTLSSGGKSQKQSTAQLSAKPLLPKQTYFGGNGSLTAPNNYTFSDMQGKGYRLGHAPTVAQNYRSSSRQPARVSAISKVQLPASQHQKPPNPSVNVVVNGNYGRPEQLTQKPRIGVPTPAQRRPRSPIKMPWR